MNKANIATRIDAAQRAIENYKDTIHLLEIGDVFAEIGELKANKLLLARKQKQLAKLLAEQAIENARQHPTAVAE